MQGDGLGESITLSVKRPLPLYGILIRPGYWDPGSDNTWKKNNRVAALEITLNDERTFTETIPDETFLGPVSDPRARLCEAGQQNQTGHQRCASRHAVSRYMYFAR